MADSRVEVAEKKRERARALIAEGLQPIDVKQKVLEEFGTGISGSFIYPEYHKHHGTEPRAGRGGRKRRKPARKSKTQLIIPSKTRAIEVDVRPSSPSSPTVDALLTALLRAMRNEGVDSVMLRADGRATIYHVVSREVQIGG